VTRSHGGCHLAKNPLSSSEKKINPGIDAEKSSHLIEIDVRNPKIDGI
jgi:hypothetical protein